MPFAGDLPDKNFQAYKNELLKWKCKWESQSDNPSDLPKTLISAHPDFYLNIHAAVKILLTMPVSSATAERSFSSLKRIETYLRSTMIEDRLNGLAAFELQLLITPLYLLSFDLRLLIIHICIFCPLIYGFSLPPLYLLSFDLRVWLSPLYLLSFDLRLLITPLCIFCPLIHGFWLHPFVSSVLWFTASVYPLCIFCLLIYDFWLPPLYLLYFDLGLLITHLCIFCPLIYCYWLPPLVSSNFSSQNKIGSEYIITVPGPLIL